MNNIDLDMHGYNDASDDTDMFDLDGFNNPYGMLMGDMCDGMFNGVYNVGGIRVMNFANDMLNDYINDQPYAMGSGLPFGTSSNSNDDGYSTTEDEDDGI